DLDIAGRCLQESLENFDGSGLAGAVWTQQTEALTSADFQIEPVDRIDAPVATLVLLAQPAASNRKQGFGLQIHWPLFLRRHEIQALSKAGPKRARRKNREKDRP